MPALNLKPAHKAVKTYFPLVPKLCWGTQILAQALLGDLK
jgi:hypothetical protein